MTNDQYFRKYHELLTLQYSSKECWQMIEVAYKKAHGRNRYKNYNTFRVMLTRWRTKLKERMIKP